MVPSMRQLMSPLASVCLFAASPQPEVAPWTVKVTAADAAPVAQATVVLLGLRGEPVHARELTNESGEAKLQPPARGSYLIRVEKKGFKRKEMPLMTSLQEARPVVIKLEKAAE